MISEREERAIEAFWDWFRANAFELRTLGPQPQLVREMAGWLGAIHEELALEVGGDPRATLRLSVSADGITELIPLVQEIVARAPEMRGWQIVAFRQRDRSVDRVGIEGDELRVDDVFFVATACEDRLDARFYIRGLNESNYEPRVGLLFLLLDALIGEYDVMIRLGMLDFEALPPDPTLFGLRPLSELVEVVDAS